MARISISEFQFAFAFFHKFMSLTENIGKSFVVPSLLQEGGKGLSDDQKDLKGTDLVIQDSYFFQFKVGDRLVNSSKQTKNAKLEESFLPFFRFNIKNSQTSCQFKALVELGKKKGINKVFYLTPLFDYSGNRNDDGAFQDFWKSDNIVAMDKVVFIDFAQWSLTNPLQYKTNNKHVICYNYDSVNDGLGYMFSKKKEIQIGKFDLNLLNEPNTLLEAKEEINQIAMVLKGFVQNENRKMRLDEVLNNSVISDIEAIYRIQEILFLELNTLWFPTIKKNN